MADPYVLPNGTLRNKLSIWDAESLAHAEAQLTGQRLSMIEEDGPQGPFTFERLKETHRYIFQDVYEWAGKPRTIPLGKQAHVGGPVHHFTPPDQIEVEATKLLASLRRNRYLKGLERDVFARRAAVLFGRINELHPFREGNGRVQRVFTGALAREAGHELAFDVVSRERMIKASVQFHQSGADMMRRMFDEISDPDRAGPLREAIRFLESQNYDWNSRYLATTEPGQLYRGTLVGRSGDNFMFHDGKHILVGQTKDLEPVPESGAEIAFVAEPKEHGRESGLDRGPSGRGLER